MIGKNNPFNIRYTFGSNWIGRTGQTKGFCNFSSLEYGVRACAILLFRSYRKLNVLTVTEIISRFAPSSENDTDKYIQFVCNKCGIFPFDIPRDKFEMCAVMHAMSIFEGNSVSLSFIESVISEFNIKLYGIKRSKR